MRYMHATLADCTAASLYLKQSKLGRFTHTCKPVTSRNLDVILARGPATVNAAPCLSTRSEIADGMRSVDATGSVHAEI